LVRPATVLDYGAIHAVEAAAFRQQDEALMVEASRAEGTALAELVEVRDGRVVGHILFNRMITNPTRFVAGLAPVAVDPAYQGQGIGEALCRAGIAAMRAMGCGGVVVLGHPTYYPRFGFSHALAAPLGSPYADRDAFMALELTPGALSPPLRVDYPAAFS
jgi:putative acetyltransferase